MRSIRMKSALFALFLVLLPLKVHAWEPASAPVNSDQCIYRLKFISGEDTYYLYQASASKGLAGAGVHFPFATTDVENLHIFDKESLFYREPYTSSEFIGVPAYFNYSSSKREGSIVPGSTRFIVNGSPDGKLSIEFAYDNKSSIAYIATQLYRSPVTQGPVSIEQQCGLEDAKDKIEVLSELAADQGARINALIRYARANNVRVMDLERRIRLLETSQRKVNR